MQIDTAWHKVFLWLRIPYQSEVWITFEEISRYCFSHCNRLQSILIPASVQLSRRSDSNPVLDCSISKTILSIFLPMLRRFAFRLRLSILKGILTRSRGWYSSQGNVSDDSLKQVRVHSIYVWSMFRTLIGNWFIKVILFVIQVIFEALCVLWKLSYFPKEILKSRFVFMQSHSF
jgi:hypothetical protein